MHFEYIYIGNSFKQLKYRHANEKALLRCNCNGVSIYLTHHPLIYELATHQRPVYQLHIIRCGTIIILF